MQKNSKPELNATNFFNFTIIESMNADKIWKDFKKQKRNFWAISTFVLIVRQVCSRIFGVCCFVSKHLFLEISHKTVCCLFRLKMLLCTDEEIMFAVILNSLYLCAVSFVANKLKLEEGLYHRFVKKFQFQEYSCFEKWMLLFSAKKY
jgi:hypothetical protein